AWASAPDVDRTRVAAGGLVGGGPDVVDGEARLERPHVGRRESHRVHPDRAEHLDVLPEVRGVGGGDQVEEAGRGEHGRSAHQLRPVTKEGKARPGQARVPLVRVVHPDERARATRGPARQLRLLAERHARAPRGHGVGDRDTDDATTDHYDVGCLRHALELGTGTGSREGARPGGGGAAARRQRSANTTGRRTRSGRGGTPAGNGSGVASRVARNAASWRTGAPSPPTTRARASRPSASTSTSSSTVPSRRRRTAARG